MEEEKIINKLSSIENQLSALVDNKLMVVQVIGNAILTSTNLSQLLNSNYEYSLSIRLLGTVTGDVAVHMDPVSDGSDNILSNSTIYLNNTVSGYNIDGISLNNIYVDSSITASVYISFIGYNKDNKQAPKIVMI